MWLVKLVENFDYNFSWEFRNLRGVGLDLNPPDLLISFMYTFYSYVYVRMFYVRYMKKAVSLIV